MSEAKPPAKKKRQFKPAGAALVQGLLSGADDVATRSFLGGGQGSTESAPASGPDAAEESAVPRLPPQTVESAVTSASGRAKAVKEQGDEPEAAPAGSAEEGPGTVVPSLRVPEPQAPRPAAPAPVARKKSVRPSASSSSAGQASAEEIVLSAAKPAVAQPAAGQQDRRAEREPWAHAAVHESFTDAKMRSSSWTAYGFRIAPDVLARLKERLNADRASSGNRQLAIGHYLDAALREVPGGVEEWIDLATDFATERLWDAAATQPSSYRAASWPRRASAH
ncbi:hypothetical protein ACWCOW_41365 [Streptomyces sp. NPDC001939]